MGLYDRDYMQAKDDDYLKGDYGYANAPIGDSVDAGVHGGEGTQYRVVGTRSMYVVNAIVAALGVLVIGLMVIAIIPITWGAEPAHHRLAIGNWSLDVERSAAQRMVLERRVVADTKREMYQLLQKSMLKWMREFHTEISRPDRIVDLKDWKVELRLHSDGTFHLAETTPRGQRNDVKGSWSASAGNEQSLILESGKQVNYVRLNVDRMIFVSAPNREGIPLCTIKKPVAWRW